MRIAFIGHGHVGGTLADRFQRNGHDVTLAVDGARAESTRKAREQNSALATKPTREAILGADVVFLATPFPAVA
jgi:predicted dinucleotide-binding enzyme